MKRFVLAAALLAIGCDDPRLLASGEGPDAGAPAADASATAGVVGLVVTQHGTPEAGVVVYFQNADSSLVARAVTDLTGTARATMATGGFVTAVLAGQTSSLYTFAAVKPGDQLVLDDVVADPQLDVFSTTPSDPGAPSLAYYYLFSTCADVWYQVQPDVQTGLGQARTGLGDMMAVMTSNWEGEPIDYLYLPNVLVGNGSTIQLYGNYQTAQDMTFNYVNLPSAASIEFRSYVVTPRGVLFDAPLSTYATASSGNATIAASVPAIPGTLVVTESYVATSSAVGSPAHDVLDWGEPTVSHALDYAAGGVHEYGAAPAFDSASDSITWGESGARPDYVFAEYITWRRGATTTLDWPWEIVAPRSESASVRYPVLPVDEFDYNPEPADTLAVEFVDNISVPGGYDAVRPWAFESYVPTTFARHLGGTGHVVVSRFAPP